jgi:hypothetical protein
VDSPPRHKGTKKFEIGNLRFEIVETNRFPAIGGYELSRREAQRDTEVMNKDITRYFPL